MNHYQYTNPVTGTTETVTSKKELTGILVSLMVNPTENSTGYAISLTSRKNPNDAVKSENAVTGRKWLGVWKLIPFTKVTTNP